MRLFLISKIPAYLKINGELLIKIDQNLKYFDYANEIFFVEFLPVNLNLEPIYCEFENNKRLKIFDFLDGKLLFPTFNVKRNKQYSIINQKHFSLYGVNHLLTVITDGSIKFYLDGNLVATDELPFIPTDFDVKVYNDYIILSFIDKMTALFIYSVRNGKLELAYKDVVYEFNYDSVLTVKKCINTPISAFLIENWEFSTPLKLTNVSLNSNFSIYSVNKKILPFYFFENFKYGYVETSILCENLKNRVNDLLSFIGKPVLVFPNPYNIDQIAVITESNVKVYSLEFNNNLISNILEN